MIMRSQYHLYLFVTSKMQISPSYSVFTLKLGHKSQTKQQKGQKLKLAEVAGEFGAALIRTDLCIEPGTGKTTLIYFRKQRGHGED